MHILRGMVLKDARGKFPNYSKFMHSTIIQKIAHAGWQCEPLNN